MVNEVMKFITSYDKEVGEAIELECARQRRNLERLRGRGHRGEYCHRACQEAVWL